MKINIKSKNIILTQPIKNFVEEKINPLEKFIKVMHDGKYSSPSSGKEKQIPVAWVEIGKETKHHKKGPFFRAECQIVSFGKSVRAEAVSKDLRAAIIKIKDELQIELKKEKGKRILKRRKGKAFAESKVLQKEI